jgi:2-hydroxychromene-2-carboxylate isomerase
MREKIDYYFSLISPWAYLGHGTFMELAATNGLDVTDLSAIGF